MMVSSVTICAYEMWANQYRKSYLLPTTVLLLMCNDCSFGNSVGVWGKRVYNAEKMVVRFHEALVAVPLSFPTNFQRPDYKCLYYQCSVHMKKHPSIDIRGR